MHELRSKRQGREEGPSNEDTPWWASLHSWSLHGGCQGSPHSRRRPTKHRRLTPEAAAPRVPAPRTPQ